MSRGNRVAGFGPLSAAGMLTSGYALMLAAAGTASAQSVTTTTTVHTRGPTLEQVVVTAARKKQTLQEAPVAVTFISPATTKNLDIRSIHSLSLISPSVSFSSQVDYAQLYIRGIGSEYANPGLEPSVAIYEDGVYSTAAYGSVLANLDTAGIQVLNGPQGVTWGRNASGGAVLVDTENPTNKQGGYISTELGMYNHEWTDLVYNQPISDDLRVRFAGRFQNDGGYIHNDNGGHNLQGGYGGELRGKIDWTPSAAPGLDITASFDYSYLKEWHDNQQETLQAPLCLACAIYGVKPPTGFYDTNQNNDAFIQRNSFSYVRVNYVNGPITYTSLTGWRQADFGAPQGSDQDYTSAPLFSFHSYAPGTTVTEDLQMQTNYSGPLNFIAGLSYMNDRRSFYSEFYGDAFAGAEVGPYAGIVPVNHSNVLTKSVSGFIQATYDFYKNFALDVGGRYNVDHRDLSAQNNDLASVIFQGIPFGTTAGTSFAEKATFYSFTPHYAVRWKSPIGDIYISDTKGFKAGGFSTPDFAGTGIISPEKNESQEIGIKSRWMDGRLTTSFTGFHYNDSNLQVQITDVNAGGSVTVNAGSSEGYGIEASTRFAATQDLILGLGGDWLHADFTDFTGAAEACVFGTGAGESLGACNVNPKDGPVSPYTNLTGTVLPHAPKFTGYLTAEYSFPVFKGFKATLAGVLNYTSTFDFVSGAGGQLGLDKQSGYALMNINGWITPDSGKYRVGFYLDNATATKYNDFATTGQPYGAYHQAAAPIEFGAKLQYNFGDF